MQEIGKFLRGLARFCEMRSWFQEARELFGQAVAVLQNVGEPDRATQHILSRVAVQQGWFDIQLGQYGKAKDLLEHYLAVLRTLNIPEEIALGLNVLGSALYELGDFTQAKHCFAESLEIIVSRLATIWKWLLLTTI